MDSQGVLYPPGLWYSEVLAGGEERHREVVATLVEFLARRRATQRGFSIEVREQEAAAAAWLVEGLTQALGHLPSVPLIVPRTKNKFSKSARQPLPFGFHVTMRIVRALEDLGWVTVAIGDVHRGISRISPTGPLFEHCMRLSVQWVERPGRAPDRLIVMSDGKRSILDDEDVRVPVWRTHLRQINHFLGRQCVYLRVTDRQLVLFANEIAAHSAAKAMDSAGRRGGRRSPKVVGFARVGLHRTFSGAFDLGGRFYGPWWQNLPSRLRPYIWINQWQGVEVDYSGMAIRCLYADEGLVVPDSDPYDIGLGYVDADDPRREVVKEYLNAVINDKRGQYRPDAGKLALIGLTKKELDARLRSLHAGIAHRFHSDAGLRMQFVDAQIAEGVMLNLMERGIVVLPIHDSFIVQAPYVEELKAEMERVFRQVTGRGSRLKGVRPAEVRHYADPVVTVEEQADPEVLHMHLDFEYLRMSRANDYFFSWVQQNWTEADLVRAFAELEAAPIALLKHHAFPLRLLQPESVDEGKEDQRAGMRDAGGTLHLASSSFPIPGMHDAGA